VTRRYTQTHKRWLYGILFFAVAIRIVSAVYQGDTVPDSPGIHDQISYDRLARRVAQGHGFSFSENHWPATPAGEPTAHWSYIYTLFIAAAYAVFGFHPLIARLIQSVLAGILHAWLACRIGDRIFGPPAGLAAAGMTAAYIYFVHYGGALMTETFYFVAILWTFDATFRILDCARRQESRLDQPFKCHRIAAELGVAIGFAVLLRQVFWLFIPFLYFWLWRTALPFYRNSIKSSETAAPHFIRNALAVSTITILAMIAPFTIYNYSRFRTFVLLNTNVGFAFYWGNHPIHGTDFKPILSTEGSLYGKLIPREFRLLNEAEMDRALLKEGLRVVLTDPGRYLRLCATRTREYLKFWPSKESNAVSNICRVASFGLLLPFFLHGAWISALQIRKPKHPDQRAQILLVYAFVFIYSIIHIMTWTLIRYRLPVDLFLIIVAGRSVAGLRLANRRVLSLNFCDGLRSKIQ
jgi:hypothetical protein